MTSLDHGTATGLDGAARSILARPGAVHLVADGVDDVLGDLATPPGLHDRGGVPTLSTPVGTRLARAATERRRARLRIGSGLGPAGSADRAAVLDLGGLLEARGRETCACCEAQRETVALLVDRVVLTPGGRAPTRVPVERFRSARHLLNRGYLERTAEHATLGHQAELRRAVSTLTGTRLAEVVGVSLTGLSAAGVDVQWVGLDGSHVRPLVFGRVAATPAELSDILRRELHAGLC